MSTEKKETGLGIVNAIAKFLKLGDVGVIDKFFTRELRYLNRNLNTLESNAKAIQAEWDAKVEEINEEIEDAEESLNEAYLNVDVDSLKKNADMDSYRSQYWNKISRCRTTLKNLKEDLTAINDKYEGDLKLNGSKQKETKESIKVIKEFK